MDRTWPNLAAKRAENDPKMAPQDDPKSIKNRVQKMIKILIAFKTTDPALLGLARRNAQASWGDYRGGKKLRQRRYAARCRELLIRSWQVWQLQQLRSWDLTRRDLAPPGRAADLIASRIPPGRVVLVGELFGCGSALLSCGVAGFTLCSL